MIETLYYGLYFDIDKWNKKSEVRFTYSSTQAKNALLNWKDRGIPFNTTCDIVNAVMKKKDFHNLVSFVLKAGSGEFEYEQE